MSRKEMVDYLQSKFISRKLLVFVIASVGLFIGKISSMDWVVISSIYLSVQSVKDVFVELKNKTNNE